MCSRTPYAPGGNAGAWLTLLIAVVSAAGAAPAAAQVGGVVPVGATVDQFELAPPGQSPSVTIELRAGVTPGGAEAQATPVVVPLPPALGTGLAGLGAMGLLRVSRRVYRRR